MSFNSTKDAPLTDLTTQQILHTLGKSVRKYKMIGIISIIFSILEIACEAAIPFITAMLLDKVKLTAEIPVIINYGLLLCFISALGVITGSIAGYLGADAATGFAKNLRHDMFYNIQDYSHDNIGKFSPSSLVTRMTTDVMNVQRLVLLFIVIASRGPVMFIFGMFMAWYMAGKMAAIYVAVTPFMILGLVLMVKTILPIFRRVFKRYDKLNLRINENIHGIRTVKSFVRESFELGKFKDATQDLYHDYTKAEKILQLAFPLLNTAIACIFVFVIYFGSKTIIVSRATDLDVGQMSALITYGFMILFSLLSLSMLFANLTLSRESANRIAEVLIEKPTITNPQNPLYEVRDGEISFKHVYFKYSKNATNDVLKDIDLTIPSGSTVGIIGATGSAKTSLAQLIARLYDATEGEVLVGGENVKKYDLNTLRQSVALVEQKNMLFAGTITENLRWGKSDASIDEIKEVCKIACADEFINTFKDGYNTVIEQGGTNVSGGQKQRLCIARALLKHPKVLIFDDSTSAVDTKTDAKIRTGLKSFAPETTKFIIAQRISSVKDADMIIILNRGMIEHVGTHEELLKTSKIYRETFETQTNNSEGGEE